MVNGVDFTIPEALSGSFCLVVDRGLMTYDGRVNCTTLWLMNPVCYIWRLCGSGSLFRGFIDISDHAISILGG